MVFPSTLPGYMATLNFATNVTVMLLLYLQDISSPYSSTF